MKKNVEQIAEEILAIIKPENIISCSNCLTRLRLNINPSSDIDLQKIKDLAEVIEVLSPSANELQIVLGPLAAKIANVVNKLLNNSLSSKKTSDFNTKNTNTSNLKLDKKNSVQLFFSKFSKIFSPMIIGFIGAGILAGVAGIIQTAYGGSIDNAPGAAVSWFKALNLLLSVWKNAFLVIVAWRTAEIFNASGVIAAIAAVIYVPAFASAVKEIIIIDDANSVSILGIKILNPLSNWLTIGFDPKIQDGVLTFGAPVGNILGVLLTATFAIFLEKELRKYIKVAILDTILTPTLTLFILLLLNFFLLIPISGYMYYGVSWFFAHLYDNPFGAFVLASIFLLTVSFGIHQGFIPVYAMLVHDTGINGLFPILAMAGMSQIGTVMALWLKAEKGSKLRQQIEGGFFPALCGIAEPLIYGVSLPRVKPLVTTGLGAGIAGFFLGAVTLWGKINFGLNAEFGPSGFLAIIMITTTTGNVGLGVAIYLIGALIAIVSGFLITLFAYSSVGTIGVMKMKELYSKQNPKVYSKILLTMSFLTIIGILIFWITEYYKLEKTERIKIKEIKVE